MSYWLRSVATSRIRNRSTCRADSTSQRCEAGSARWTSSTAISSGARSEYECSTRRNSAAPARSSPANAASPNSGTGAISCSTVAYGTPWSRGEQRARSTRIPCARASATAASSTVVRPVPVAPRNSTSRPAPALAHAASTANIRAASRCSGGSADMAASDLVPVIVVPLVSVVPVVPVASAVPAAHSAWSAVRPISWCSSWCSTIARTPSAP